MDDPDEPAANSGPDVVDDRSRMSALGARVRVERQKRNLSLDALATRSNVSRSMLSAIERGVKVPTVFVLDRIANALGISVSRLLEQPSGGRVVHLRATAQQVVADEVGWRRTLVSPVLPNIEIEIGRLEFEPGADAGRFAPHQPGWTEYVVVERGALEITLNGADSYRLDDGDAIYYESDVVHAFRNPGDRPTVAYIVMLGGPAGRSVS